jgi:hypothetical protein
LASGRFRITHPFHPLRGQELVAVDERWSWGKRWLYCSEEDGGLFCVPAQWTDDAEQDPFVLVSAGRAWGRVEDLLRLADMVQRGPS